MTRNIWIGIVVVVVLVAGGWWYFNQSSAPATSETVQLPSTQNTNTGTQTATNPAPAKSAYISGLQNISLSTPSLNTATWVQYTDEQGGVSFRYDPSWKIQKTTGSVADSILVIVDSSTVVSIALYHDKRTLDDMVRSALSERCMQCTFKQPIVNTLPNGKYVVEVYAYDTYNKVDMRPGTFYFGNNKGQFSMRGEGVSAPAATIAILNTLNF